MRCLLFVSRRFTVCSSARTFVIGLCILGILAFSAQAQTATTTTLSSTNNPAIIGQLVTLTATVTGQSGTPTGMIAFQNAGNTFATIALNAIGQSSYTRTFPSAGARSLTAVYSGDANNRPSTSPILGQMILSSAAATTTALSASNATIFVGQPVTFTATATSGSGSIPDGDMVAFKDATTTPAVVLATVPLSGGVATYTTSSLARGTHTVKATYLGETDFSPSVSPLITETVQRFMTTTAVTADLNPTIPGQPVRFIAMVSSASGTTPPDGETVTFYNNGVAIGTAPLAGGQASFTKTFAATGTKMITASYPGDVTNKISTSAPLSESVDKFTTTTMLVGSPSTSVTGQAVTLNAVVGGNGVPTTGTVAFVNGSTTMATVPLTNGVASYTKTFAAPGTKALSAVYSGDTNYTTSTGTASQTVNAAVTSVTLTSQPNGSQAGQDVTFTATVTSPSSPAGGTVTFIDGNSALATVNVSSGKAVYSTTAMTEGTHVLTAVYSDTFNSAQATSSPMAQVVQSSSSQLTPAYSITAYVAARMDICPETIPPTQYTYERDLSYPTVYQTSLVLPPFGAAYSNVFRDPNQGGAFYPCLGKIFVLGNAVRDGHIISAWSDLAVDQDAADHVTGAGVGTQLYWSDSFYIGGLPDGSPAVLQVTFSMGSNVSGPPGPNCTVAQYQGYIQDPQSTTGNGLSGVIFRNGPCEQGAANNLTNTQMVSVTSGFNRQPIAIFEYVTTSDAGGPRPTASVVSVSDVHMTIQAITPGAFVVTTSGVDYSH